MDLPWRLRLPDDCVRAQKAYATTIDLAVLQRACLRIKPWYQGRQVKIRPYQFSSYRLYGNEDARFLQALHHTPLRRQSMVFVR